MHRLLQREIRAIRDGNTVSYLRICPWRECQDSHMTSIRVALACIVCGLGGSNSPCEPQSIMSDAACLSKAYSLRHQDHMAVTIRNPVSPLPSMALLVDTLPFQSGRTEVDCTTAPHLILSMRASISNILSLYSARRKKNDSITN